MDATKPLKEAEKFERVRIPLDNKIELCEYLES
jgi:hypothetical protein